jgi:hypothetical protein
MTCQNLCLPCVVRELLTQILKSQCLAYLLYKVTVYRIRLSLYRVDVTCVRVQPRELRGRCPHGERVAVADARGVVDEVDEALEHILKSH